MRHRPGRRAARLSVIAAVTLSLVAAACSDKKDDESVQTGSAGSADTTDTADTADTDTTEPEAPVVSEPPASEFEPVMGGSIVVAGEAESANPWTPANVNCDSFCAMRARTFYDPLIVLNEDLEVAPYLAQSVEANEDATEFTITLLSLIHI